MEKANRRLSLASERLTELSGAELRQAAGGLLSVMRCNTVELTCTFCPRVPTLPVDVCEIYLD